MVTSMKQLLSIAAFALLFAVACSKPEIEITDFDTFHVLNVGYGSVIENGSLNPDIHTMEVEDEAEAKIASTAMSQLVKTLIET